MVIETVSPILPSPPPLLKITDVECYALLAPDFDPGFTSSAQDTFVVVIRTDDGQYISRDGGASPNRNEAARYFMIADRVEDQIAIVEKLYGRTMTLEGA